MPNRPRAWRAAWRQVWPPAAIFLGLVLVLSRPIGLWTVPIAGVCAGSLAWAGRRYAHPGLRELGRYVAGFVAFTAARHVADDLGPAAFVRYPIVADRFLFLGHLPSEWMQAHWPGLTVPAALLYTSYFFVPPLAPALLWRWWPDRLRPFVSATLACFGLAALVHVVLPTAPPWLAAHLGVIDGVRPLVLEHYQVTVPTVYHIGTGVASNPVAAMPSVHLAVTALLLCALWSTWLRAPAALYLALMAWAVVYSGDHYVVDVLAGVALAYATWRWASASPRGVR
jgi:membrane-associated phospholipid phosphatase